MKAWLGERLNVVRGEDGQEGVAGGEQRGLWLDWGWRGGQWGFLLWRWKGASCAM